MRVSIKSLGCKINQFDAGVIRDRLACQGAVLVPDGEAADIRIINTCTVTKKSDYQCRQAIRRAVKEKTEGGKVIVTGCYARTNPEEIRLIEGVDLVVGGDAQDTLAGLIDFTPLEATPALSALPAQCVTGRSRAFLKAQDGCDAYCSYCIVPFARGSARSAPPADVLDMADGLIAQGYHEIVLTGVHLGSYGKDLADGSGVAGLVRRLLDRPGLGRLRLSSIEPMELDGGMFEIIQSEAGSGLCRHFHVPLQSASDKVLGSMGRNYTADEYFDTIGRLQRAAPESCLGADVIVGYPAEDDDAFERTFLRIEDSPINYLHVFTYSPRPGTRAYALGDPVRGDVKRGRSQRLRDLAGRKSEAFKKGALGKTMTVVVEGNGKETSGLTDNYIRVRFEGKALAPKSAVSVRIDGLKEGVCTGVVI